MQHYYWNLMKSVLRNYVNRAHPVSSSPTAWFLDYWTVCFLPSGELRFIPSVHLLSLALCHLVILCSAWRSSIQAPQFIRRFATVQKRGCINWFSPLFLLRNGFKKPSIHAGLRVPFGKGYFPKKRQDHPRVIAMWQNSPPDIYQPDIPLRFTITSRGNGR